MDRASAGPTEHGGRGLPLTQEVIFHEEYARAGGPGRAGLVGEGLLGPTLIHFGDRGPAAARSCPGIVAGTEYWCQGYSEPNAGSDLANVRTTARLEGDEWVHQRPEGVDLAGAVVRLVLRRVPAPRPAPSATRDCRYLLIRMDAPGIEVRPITQITGTAEFNEVFFSDARTPADHIVGAPGDGWKVAMGTLAFERACLTLGQQMAFERELNGIIDDATKQRRRSTTRPSASSSPTCRSGCGSCD